MANNRYPKNNHTALKIVCGLAGVLVSFPLSFALEAGILICFILVCSFVNPQGMIGVENDLFIVVEDDLNLKRHQEDLEQYVTSASCGRGENWDYTVMVYLLGSTLEESNQCATDDMLEMIQAKLADEVRVVVYTGGTQNWKNNLVARKVNQVYVITKDGIQLDTEFDRSNMADPNVLSKFISYTRNNFPANHQGLIVWDHGNGPVYGFGNPTDVNCSVQEGTMNVQELADALRSGLNGDKLDFFAFDACLMGNLEVLYQMSEFTDYVVASPESTDAIGFQYTYFLENLSENPDADTETIAGYIAEGYGQGMIDEYGEGSDLGELYSAINGDPYILSCVYDVRNVDRVSRALEAFSKKLYADCSLNQIRATFYQVAGYGGGAYDLLDLGFIASLYAHDYPELSQELMNSLDRLVVKKVASDNVGFSSGISVYFPSDPVNVDMFMQEGLLQDYFNLQWGCPTFNHIQYDAATELLESNDDLVDAIFNYLENAS